MKRDIIQNLNKETKNILFNSFFAILTLMIVIFFHKNIILTTTLILIVSIIGLLKWKSKLTLVTFLIGAIFGTISEIIVISASKAWIYSTPNILEIVPLWLFLVWGNAATFLYQTTIEIKKLKLTK